MSKCYHLDMYKVRTVNSSDTFTFAVFAAFGAVAVTLICVLCFVDGGDDLHSLGGIFVMIAIFGVVFVVGVVGMLMLLCKHLILMSVFKHGTETVGMFEDTQGYFEHGGGRNSVSSSSSRSYTRVIFAYRVGNQVRKYKSCAVYTMDDANHLKSLDTFPVKYKGKHAVILEAA